MLSIEYQVAEIKRELDIYRNQPSLIYMAEYRRKTIPPKELQLMELIEIMNNKKEQENRFTNMKEAKKVE